MKVNILAKRYLIAGQSQIKREKKQNLEIDKWKVHTEVLECASAKKSYAIISAAQAIFGYRSGTAIF